MEVICLPYEKVGHSRRDKLEEAVAEGQQGRQEKVQAKAAHCNHVVTINAESTTHLDYKFTKNCIF